jgi:hypothetical protein
LRQASAAVLILAFPHAVGTEPDPPNAERPNYFWGWRDDLRVVRTRKKVKMRTAEASGGFRCARDEGFLHRYTWMDRMGRDGAASGFRVLECGDHRRAALHSPGQTRKRGRAGYRLPRALQTEGNPPQGEMDLPQDHLLVTTASLQPRCPLCVPCGYVCPPFTDHRLLITDHRLPVAVYRLPLTVHFVLPPSRKHAMPQSRIHAIPHFPHIPCRSAISFGSRLRECGSGFQ